MRSANTLGPAIILSQGYYDNLSKMICFVVKPHFVTVMARDMNIIVQSVKDTQDYSLISDIDVP